jgi:hydrogenase maturation protease
MNRTLVIGIGNDILTDDGIGPRIVNDLKKDGFPPDIYFQNEFVGGLEILDVINGFDKVIFIDAIITETAQPGTVSHFTPDHFRETLHLSNLHDANFLVALELGRKMGFNIPEEIHIIAVEVVEDRVFNDQLSPEISGRYHDIFLNVNDLVRSLTV